jgi:hypothetical protein
VQKFCGMAGRCSRRVRLEAEVAGLDGSDSMIAKPVAAACSSPSPDNQQGLAQLAVPRSHLHQALPGTLVSSAWRFGTVSPTVCHLPRSGRYVKTQRFGWGLTVLLNRANVAMSMPYSQRARVFDRIVSTSAARLISRFPPTSSMRDSQGHGYTVRLTAAAPGRSGKLRESAQFAG